MLLSTRVVTSSGHCGDLGDFHLMWPCSKWLSTRDAGLPICGKQTPIMEEGGGRGRGAAGTGQAGEGRDRG